MIETLIGAKLQNSAGGNIPAPGRKQVDAKQTGNFHHALAEPTGHLRLHNHSPGEQTRFELAAERPGKQAAQFDAAKDKEPAPQKTGDVSALTAPSACLVELIANLGNSQELFQIAFSTQPGNADASTAEKELPQFISSLPEEICLKNTVSVSAERGLLAAKGKANRDEPSLTNGNETLRKSDLASAIAVSAPMQEVKKAGGFEGLVSLPGQQASFISTPADAKVFPQVPFQQGLAGSADATSHDVAAWSGASTYHSPEMVEVLSRGFHLATNSRTLRLQIDDPELGNISARFGSGTDGVSVTLATKDQDSLLAVSELQRDMKIWLDLTNKVISDKTELNRDGTQSLNGYEGQQPDRRGESQGNFARRGTFGSIILTDNDGSVLSGPDSAWHPPKRWRHI